MFRELSSKGSWVDEASPSHHVLTWGLGKKGLRGVLVNDNLSHQIVTKRLRNGGLVN